MNKRSMVTNSPMCPSIWPTSTQVGTKYDQLDGRKSRCKLVTMMTKRSNHMPTFTRMDIVNRIHGVLRAFLNQKICGVITLHVNMIQNAQAYGPKARLRNTKRSTSSPLYQAVKNSVVYA